MHALQPCAIQRRVSPHGCLAADNWQLAHMGQTEVEEPAQVVVTRWDDAHHRLMQQSLSRFHEARFNGIVFWDFCFSLDLWGLQEL